MDLTFTAKTLSNSSSVTCAVGCIIVNSRLILAFSFSGYQNGAGLI